MKRFLIIVLITIVNNLLITSVSWSQSPSESLLEQELEDLVVHNKENNSVDNFDWEEELEALALRLKEPLNLNTATRSDLEQFPFLTDGQIEQLLAYIYLNGEMKTVYELQLVEQMDRQTIRYLLPFVCVKPVDKPVYFWCKDWFQKVFRYGKHQLITRFDIPFYKQKGYTRSYLGPAVYNAVKYEFRYSDHLYVGCVGEKDAGEPFAALHNRTGYDYHSFYVYLKNMSWLKALAVGNYRLSWGQGLVVNNGFFLGKSMYTPSFIYRERGITKHASTFESNYFRGLALTVACSPHWECSAFYSHRWMDGNTKDGVLISMNQTGLHRSQREVDRQHTFVLQATGGKVSFRYQRFHAGINGIYYFLNRSYQPKLTGYTKYQFHGMQSYNVSVDYAWYSHRWSLQGETACGKRGWASLNRLQYLCSESTRLMLIQRYFSHDYWTLFARAFGEGSQTQNEQGYYLGINTVLFRYWNVQASLDWFYFPWKKYRISRAGTWGIEGTLQTNYSPTQKFSLSLRYRYKQKERDVTGSEGKKTVSTYRHQCRCRIGWTPISWLSLRTTVDYVLFQEKHVPLKQGFLLSQKMNCKLFHSKFSTEFQGSCFWTNHYDARVYVSEKGPLYAFYTPSFHGRGYRCSLHLRYDLNEHWMFLAKLGETIYTDRKEIGSGDSQIDGNKKVDLQLQMRLKF